MILLKLFEIRSIQNHLMWVTEPGVTCQLHITDLLLSSLNILNISDYSVFDTNFIGDCVIL